MIGKMFIQQSDCTALCTFTPEHYHPEREREGAEHEGVNGLMSVFRTLKHL